MSYLGVSFSFAAGSTTNKYTYWRYNNGLGSGLQFTDDPTIIAALTDDDCLLFLNRNGLPVNALTASMTYGDLIVPGTILAQNIGAHIIDSTLIKAGGITAQNLTLVSNYALVPNGSFDEVDQVDSTKPAFWVSGSGDGVRSLDTVTVKSPGGFSVKMTQTVGANLLTSGDFPANITGWTASGATITWQSGLSASGQMKVSIATAAATPTITSPSFAVTAGKYYNLVISMEADGTGASPTAPVAINQQIQWLSSTGAVLSTSSYLNQSETQISTAVDAFDVVQQEFLAPVGAVTAKVLIGIPSDPAQATLHYIDYVHVRQSTVAEMWSDVVPITAGEWVKVTFWAIADVVTSDTLISALHFHASDPLFTPATAQASIDPITGYSTIDSSADLGFNTTWTKYTGTIQIPAGMNYMRAVLGTDPGSYETTGTYSVYFDDADIENISSGNIQSSDFVLGTSGWALFDAGGTSQVENLNVVAALGADSISANTLSLGGQDLQADILSPIGSGVIAQATMGNSTADTATVSSAQLMVVFTASNLKAGRAYKITYGAPINGTVSGDLFFTRVYYTTDGTTPIIGGLGIMDGSICPVTVVAGQTVLGEHSYYYYPSADVDTLKLGFVLVRAAGTGTAKYVMTNTNLPFYAAVEDAGDASVVTGTLSQKSKVTSGGVSQPSDPDPVTVRTKAFYPNQSRSYDSDGTRRAGDTNTSDMYQGRYSSTHGNTMSCAVYDWTSIQSALSGATNIKVKLTFRVKHAYQGSGLNVSVHQHTYSGSNAPTTYRPGGEIATKTGCKEGSTYTITLPSSFATALQSGSMKGIGFGKPGSTSNVWYGYLYGAGSGAAPVLTITYTK